jgi:hypothetical protein
VRGEDVVQRVEDAGGAVWLDAKTGRVCHTDVFALLPPEVLALIAAHVPELTRALRRWPCRVGFARGAAAWHVVYADPWGLTWACRLARVPRSAADLTEALPPASPTDRLCGHCVRSLVRRELARLDGLREAV